MSFKVSRAFITSGTFGAPALADRGIVPFSHWPPLQPSDRNAPVVHDLVQRLNEPLDEILALDALEPIGREVSPRHPVLHRHVGVEPDARRLLAVAVEHPVGLGVAVDVLGHRLRRVKVPPDETNHLIRRPSLDIVRVYSMAALVIDVHYDTTIKKPCPVLDRPILPTGRLTHDV